MGKTSLIILRKMKYYYSLLLTLKLLVLSIKVTSNLLILKRLSHTFHFYHQYQLLWVSVNKYRINFPLFLQYKGCLISFDPLSIFCISQLYLKVDGFPIHVLVEQHKSCQSSEMQVNLYASTENVKLGNFLKFFCKRHFFYHGRMSFFALSWTISP